jgi:DNA end-binding protein Ku
MAPRSNWKGYLKLSLVSCPVQLFPATTTKDRVAFHLLSRETGNRLRRKLVDPETDEAVESDEQVKGYEVAKDEYVVMDEGEIDSVAIESTHTIDIETFVPRAEIDATFLDTPYYLAPNGKMGEEAFAVIREAMREKGVVGIGRVVLYRRERPIMLEPRGKGLVATTLHYAYEVREDEDYFEEIDEVEVPEEMLDLATHIIGRKLSHFDPKRFEDRYQNALLDLIKAKQQHQPITTSAPAPKAGNVVSLMDALRKSIASDTAANDAKPSKAAAKSAEKASDKAPAKAAAKASHEQGATKRSKAHEEEAPAAKPAARRAPPKAASKAAQTRLKKAS